MCSPTAARDRGTVKRDRAAVAGWTARAPVAGRRRELAALEAWLEPSEASPGLLVLDGEAGIGKTTLWEHTCHEAAQRSWHVLAARAAESEIRFTHVVLRDLLQNVRPNAMDELSAPQRRALEVALLRADPEEDPPAWPALAAGLLATLTSLADAKPVLVAVDDAQWLDAASAGLLEFIARRLGRQQLGMLFSHRTGSSEPFSYQRTGARVTRIEVGPLELDALHTLVHLSIGSPLPRRQLAEVERISGGNPLFALELARAYVDRKTSSGRRPAMPSTLPEAVLARTLSLPAPVKAELLVAAVSARPTLDLIGSQALAVAKREGVVQIGWDDTLVFSHPLFAWAFQHQASAQELRAAHAQAAGRAEDHDERITHLALSTTGTSEQLARELEDAAIAARARGTPAAAADLLQHALRLTPQADHEAWARRCATKIAALVAAGDWARAWELGQAALELLPAGRDRAAVLIEATQYRPGTVELCLQALDEAQGDPMLTIRAELALGLQALYRIDPTTAMDHFQAARTLARRLGDLPLTASVATHVGALRFLTGAGDPLPDLDEAIRIEQELASSPVPLGASPAAYRALWLSFFEGAQASLPVLERLLRRAAEAGDEASQAQLLSFLFFVEFETGNWTAAREHIDASLALADLIEFDQGRGEKRALLAWLLAYRGEIAGARATVAEGMEICEAIGDDLSRALHLAVLAFVSLTDNQPAAALESIDEIRRILPDGYDPPVWLDFEGNEIEALIAVGQTTRAEQLIGELGNRIRVEPRPRLLVWAARGLSLLLASRGDLDGATAALDPVFGEHANVGRTPFELGRTLLLMGQLQRRAKHKALARSTLEKAEAIFEELGAVTWAEKARAELARLGLRHTGQELSETERRVAELAAAGKTNKQIAAELFISRRTVEANIARIYVKLDIHTRAALASRMAVGEAGPEAPRPVQSL